MGSSQLKYPKTAFILPNQDFITLLTINALVLIEFNYCFYLKKNIKSVKKIIELVFNSHHHTKINNRRHT